MRAAKVAPGLIGLVEAAKRLGVCRETANDLVRDGLLPATRVGPWWYVQEEDLESFAATYRPRPGPRRRQSRNEEHRAKIAELLADWQDATPAELSTVIGLHPGNVRKHLVMLEAAGVAERDDEGLWRLTQAGRRYQEASARSD